MLKKCPIVMLESKGSRNGDRDIVKLHSPGQFGLVRMSCYTGLDGMQQHLYIISPDDKISKGDWYLMWMFDGWEVMQCQDEKEADRCNEHQSIKHSCKKIIASTDTSLKIPRTQDSGNTWWESVPILSDEFIDTFMERFNAKSQMDYVLIEYINVAPQKNGLRADGKIADEIYLDDEHNTLSVPRISKGCIHIHNLKQIFTRDELIEKLRLFNDTIISKVLIDNEQSVITSGTLNKWVDENLL